MAPVVAPEPDKGLAIEGAGLVKSYSGRTVVSVDHVAVREREVFAILGPNGAGKSTLFRMLALIEKPDKGIVRHFGGEVSMEDLAARRRTAAVFQRPILFQGSVRNNVAYSLRLRRIPRKNVKSRVDAALELMSIGQFAEADTRTLSGGELQRVALARALVLEPEILFLDEPTSNLDAHVRRAFREDIRSVVKKLGATVILITHDHNEALSLAQNMAVIRDGRIVQTGAPAEVFLKPVDRFVAGFMGVETLWRGRVVSCDEGMCTICTEAGILAEVIAEQPTGADVTVALRPEDVALSRATGASGEAQRTSVRNHWQGVVAAVTPSGPLVRVSVRLADGGGNETCFGGEGELVALVTRASAEELEIAPGVEVTASVKATALHVLGVSQQKGRLA